MAAVTQRISKFLGGVSKQIDTKKLDGQVTDAINAYPDPTLGLIKRPGINFLSELGASSEFTDSKWFFIQRDSDEQYVGCVTGQRVRVWNKTGVECKVNDLTIPLILNGSDNGGANVTTKTDLPVASTTGSGSGMRINVTASGGVATGFTVHTPGTGYVKDEVLTISKSNFSPAATNDLKCKVVSVPTEHYLKCSGVTYCTSSGLKPEDYNILTVQDTTFIVNKKRKILEQALPDDEITGRWATVRIKAVEYSVDYKVTIQVIDKDEANVGSATTYTYHTRNEDTFSGNTPMTKLNVSDIMSSTEGSNNGIAKQINDASNLATYINQTSFDIKYTPPTTSADTKKYRIKVTVTGGAAHDAIECFQDDVNNISKLPDQSFHGRIVKINNSANNDKDDYFAKFFCTSDTTAPRHGLGYWEECLNPVNTSPGLDKETMPHELFNTATDEFNFQRRPWTDRLVGDDVTNNHPSFLRYTLDTDGTTKIYNGTIRQAFFYSNRLGFLTGDSVVLSQSGEYSNFYHTSAQVSIASDPIDISCSAVKPAVLEGIVPQTQGLVLFSRYQQFLMHSGDGGIFTPGNTAIKAISSYEMDIKNDPVDIGDRIIFLSKTPSNTRTFAMQTRGFEENPIIIDMGKVVNEWIPHTIDQLEPNSQNKLIAMATSNSEDMYLFRTHSDGEKDVMQAWFRWKLPGNVRAFTFINDKFLVVTEQSSKLNYGFANLNMVPTDVVLTTEEGVQSNPCVDFIKNPASVTDNPIDTFTITTAGSGYTVAPTLTVTGSATATATITGGAVSAVTTTAIGSGYTANPTVTVGTAWVTSTSYSTNDVRFHGDNLYKATNSATSGSTAPTHTTGTVSDGAVTWQYLGKAAKITATYYQGSKLKLPYADVTTKTPFVFISGATDVDGRNWTGLRTTVGSDTYLSVPEKLNSIASNVYVGYRYNFDVTLPRYFYKIQGEAADYTANLTVSRMKFDVGLTGDVSFKLKRKGFEPQYQEWTATTNQKIFSYNIDVDISDVSVKIQEGTDSTQLSKTTAFTIADNSPPYTDGVKGKLTLTTAPGNGKKVRLYSNYWYPTISTSDANYYTADDVPMTNQKIFTIPVHQRSDNFEVRVFSDSPFPISLNSMMWEGQYSPRYYQRR